MIERWNYGRLRVELIYMINNIYCDIRGSENPGYYPTCHPRPFGHLQSGMMHPGPGQDISWVIESSRNGWFSHGKREIDYFRWQATVGITRGISSHQGSIIFVELHVAARAHALVATWRLVCGLGHATRTQTSKSSCNNLYPLVMTNIAIENDRRNR